MGLFSRKKKGVSSPALGAGAGAGSGSASGSSAVLPSTPSIATISITPPTPGPTALPARPSLRLRVALDPLPLHTQGADSFCVDVEIDEDVVGLRRAVLRKLGAGVGAVSLFKVVIPILAIEQAREYTERYAQRADLITLFPAFSLDDPSQLSSSLGASGWPSSPLAGAPPPRGQMRDWYPLPVDYNNTISILVRPCAGADSAIVPLTLLAHFAPPTEHSARGAGAGRDRSARASAATSPVGAGGAKATRRAPRVVDVDPTSSVDELKRRVLAATGQCVAERAQRDGRVVLWQVEMSEMEMIVIEERGGLKGGQMPWPYPPTAEVPVKLDDPAASVGKFWRASNPRMVALSVWISPLAETTLLAEAASTISASASASATATATTPAEEDAPVFTYPMLFPPELGIRRKSAHSLPNRSPTPDITVVVTADTLPAPAFGHGSSRGSRRARPSTAPAVVDSASSAGAVASSPLAAFGSRRVRSPLAHDDPALSFGMGAERGRGDVKGLGIGAPTQVPMPMPVAVDMSRLTLDVSLGTSGMLGPHGEGVSEDGKVVWYAPGGGRGGSVRRAHSSKGIRSLSHNKALRPYEVV